MSTAAYLRPNLRTPAEAKAIKIRRILLAALPLAGCCCTLLLTSCAELKQHETAQSAPHRELPLDGIWDIADGGMEVVPTTFNHRVKVPGLVSLAEPPFVGAAPPVQDRREIKQKDPRRDAFWYRRKFQLSGPIPEVATLKVSKAMFGTKVFLNGKPLGEHRPCFTPGYFDARSALRPGENEILVRVGADRDAVSTAIPSGFDFEKERYIPGIFDSVALILSSTPHFLSVQTAPDLANRSVRVQARLRNDGAPGQVPVSFSVREAKTRRLVVQATEPLSFDSRGAEQTFTLSLPMADCRLWSPEDPFLYELEATTGADTYRARFGMREFRFDPATGRAMLNGKPYFMRGSNITLYRFFEDAECKDLPWQESWVRQLHRRVKDMNWNCLRYCIGFPPEAWYRIADEEGILIQDEFPIWYGAPGSKKWPPDLQTAELATEYEEWMRERWNHPCVVVWDANNETSSGQTAAAIRHVRKLDLSNRPWDNSYEYPQDPGDVFESHPYHFIDPHFKLSQLAVTSRIPRGNVQSNDQRHAVIINEYGWLWLNRDGTPTTLTSNLYQNLLGPNSTTEQRRHLYARYTAAETEFWRCHRQAAAVMHFTTLGYSRPDGQTSDHWLNVANLRWEPEFYRYVKEAFAPVGLMVDFWKDKVLRGSEHKVPVVVINDLPEPWSGPVKLCLSRDGRDVSQSEQTCTLPAFGKAALEFTMTFPAEQGSYQLEASLPGSGRKLVHSLRDLQVVETEALGLAYGKPASASSTYEDHFPSNAVDNEPGSYWSSEFKDPAWLAIDLGQPQSIAAVRLHWETAFARAFTIEVSTDGTSWKQVYQTEKATGGISDIHFEPVRARWVRMSGTARGTKWGYAVREFQIFPSANTPSPQPNQ